MDIPSFRLYLSPSIETCSEDLWSEGEDEKKVNSPKNTEQQNETGETKEVKYNNSKTKIEISIFNSEVRESQQVKKREYPVETNEKNQPNKKVKLGDLTENSSTSTVEVSSADELQNCPSPVFSSSEILSQSLATNDIQEENLSQEQPNKIMTKNYNLHITDALETVQNTYLATGKKWNALGIRKAIVAIRQHPTKIISGTEAQHIHGIGRSIAKKIDEILETGTLRQLRDEKSVVFQLFNGIWGAGPVSIEKWYLAGYRTLEDLENNKASAELNHMQQLGLKYYHEFRLKIPRKEVEQHGKIVAKKAKSLFSNCNVEIAGSYRRGRPECGDIDIIVTTPEWAPVGMLHKLCNELKKDNFITDILEISTLETIRDWDHHFDKFMGVSKLPGGIHRRMDIIVAPVSAYAATVLYFTGSEHFNRRLRLFAKDSGFYLCNHCLSRADVNGKRTGSPIPTSSEAAIFKHLGLEYIPPSERDW